MKEEGYENEWDEDNPEKMLAFWLVAVLVEAAIAAAIIMAI